ncbi:hypothetical protein [Burkholderia sp. AU45388]|uniref:hypothetical protein n=1 Tax=Burkholderia sp. AU45388 TaxID=3059206 RepID=UPI002651C011|nr:hypothetical protein [Burkholderia sp. AU45388]MDN7426064.1 hypothetical protein [Burkholderia sp. AU45388]
MTDANANEPGTPALKQAATSTPLWLATAWTVFGSAALLLAWFSGYSTAFCDTLGGAVVWVVFFSAAAIFGVSRDYPAFIPVGLVACIAFAALARRLPRFKITWLRFLIALISVYAATGLLTWLRDVHNTCRII